MSTRCSKTAEVEDAAFLFYAFSSISPSMDAILAERLAHGTPVYPIRFSVYRYAPQKLSMTSSKSSGNLLRASVAMAAGMP